MKRLNLTGQRFGRLMVLKFDSMRNGLSYWRCLCDCGKEKVIRGTHIKIIKSCGCYRKEIFKKRLEKNSYGLKHGMWKERFYKTWDGMKQRCSNNNRKKYKNYGGRGIKVCKEWLKFENFRDDMHQSYLIHVNEFGEKQTTIDRINNNGNYCKKNCKWSTYKEQNNNNRGNLAYKNKQL